MGPRDARLFMLHVQRTVQQHIHAKWIGADNAAAFHISYNLQTPSTFQHWSAPPVTEFEFVEGGGGLLDLPDIWQATHTSAFRAIVKATFTRSREQATLVFSSSFEVGTGRVLDIVDDD